MYHSVRGDLLRPANWHFGPRCAGRVAIVLPILPCRHKGNHTSVPNLDAVTAERQPSPAAGSGSDAGADAGGSQVQGVVRGFGGCAASHVEGTGPAHALCAILVGNPWVVVTVPALVLCARLLG